MAGNLTGSLTLGSGSNSLDVQSGGALSPGSAHLESLTSGSLVSLSSGAVFDVDINGATAGSDYDQLVVGGSIDLNADTGTGATLDVNLLGGFQPTAGESFTIIKNSSGNPVAGTFAGLTEGATFTVGSQAFTITYQGNGENDVVLTAATTAVAATHYVVLPTSSSVTAGNSDGLTIEALDSSGNIDPELHRRGDVDQQRSASFVLDDNCFARERGGNDEPDRHAAHGRHRFGFRQRQPDRRQRRHFRQLPRRPAS